jgi:hypothetical protein
VELGLDQLATFEAQPGHAAGMAILSAEQAANFRARFEAVADATVPAVITAGAALIGNIVIPGPLANTTAGWLFDQILSLAGVRSMVAREVAILTAEGGIVSQRGYVLRRAEERYLGISVEYNISLGNETRAFILYCCAFPIAVKVSRFVTQSPFNNKTVSPLDNDKWGIFDQESNGWDDRNIRYSHQDTSSYYFLQDEYENNQVVGQTTLRLSFSGGTWSRQYSDSSNYAVIYPSIIAQ